MDYPGIEGFLPSRASLMLDVVVVAMAVLLPLMGMSIWLARYRRRWSWHKRIQLTLAAILLVAVAAFEIDMQLLTEWELRAEPSPYFNLADKWRSPVGIVLVIHLLFAIPTALLWVYVVSGALRQFPSPPQPGGYSPCHRLWGWVAAIGMVLTALTGWLFYGMAFVAS